MSGWLVLLTIVFLVLVLVYVWLKFEIRRTFPRHVQTKRYLGGPGIYVIFGVNPFSHKTTQLHKRFREYCEQHNDFFGFAIFNTPAVGIGDPRVVSELMNNKNYTMRMYPPLFDRYLKNRGILFTNDMPHWKIQRVAAVKGIMKNSHLKKIAVWTNNTTDKFLGRLDGTYGSSKFEIAIDPELSKLALDVIGQAAFSIDVNSVVEDNSNFTQLVTMVMNMTSKYNLLPPWVYKIYYPSGLKKGEEALNSLRDLVRVVLDERKKIGDYTLHEDLLDILLTYQKEGEQPLSDEDIILTCWDMFIAGHETTAHSLAWITYFLGHNPDVQEELFQEIQREIGNAVPNFDNIKKLSLCHNVIKESLRLRPVVPIFTRIAPTDEILNGYHVPANTPLLICNSRLHVHPQYWEEPLKFNPHRWNAIENPESVPYRPFGFGERACVGSRMTFIESKVVLAKLLSKYKIFPHDDPIEEVLQITMAPKGLKIYLEAR